MTVLKQILPSDVKNKSFVYKVKVNYYSTLKKCLCKYMVFLEIARLTNLLFENKMPVDKRGKNCSGNAIKSDIWDVISDHILQSELKKKIMGLEKRSV